VHNLGSLLSYWRKPLEEAMKLGREALTNLPWCTIWIGSTSFSSRIGSLDGGLGSSFRNHTFTDGD